MTKIVICITGKMRSGKDTAAAKIVEQFKDIGFTSITHQSISRQLKLMTKDLINLILGTNINEQELEQYKNDGTIINEFIVAKHSTNLYGGLNFAILIMLFASFIYTFDLRILITAAIFIFKMTLPISPGLTARMALQSVGTDIMKPHYGSGIHIRRFVELYASHDIVVISDARYDDPDLLYEEYKRVNGTIPFTFILISITSNRQVITQVQKFSWRSLIYPKILPNTTHITEQKKPYRSTFNYVFDISNDTTIDDLYNNLEKLNLIGISKHILKF